MGKCAARRETAHFWVADRWARKMGTAYRCAVGERFLDGKTLCRPIFGFRFPFASVVGDSESMDLVTY